MLLRRDCGRSSPGLSALDGGPLEIGADSDGIGLGSAVVSAAAMGIHPARGQAARARCDLSFAIDTSRSMLVVPQAGWRGAKLVAHDLFACAWSNGLVAFVARLFCRLL